MHFFNYLRELTYEQHGRKFVPFNLYFDSSVLSQQTELTSPVALNINPDTLFTLVNEIPARRKDTFLKKDSIKFDQVISDVAISAKENQYDNTELKFIDVFSKSMKNIYNERFK